MAQRKTRILLRILALLVVLALAIFCGGAVAAAFNNVAHPTCADVTAGNAQLPADGSCYGKSVFQQYGTLVLVCLAAVAVGSAVVLSLVLLVKGRRGRLFLVALAAGIALLLLALLLEHV